MKKIFKRGAGIITFLFCLPFTILSENFKENELPKGLTNDLKRSTKTSINKKVKKSVGDIVATNPGTAFYAEVAGPLGEKFKKILAENPEAEAIRKQGGYMTSMLYVQTKEKEYSLFLGFSQGGVIWYKFGSKNFENYIGSEYIQSGSEKEPACTAIAYVADTKELYMGFGKKTFKKKSESGWAEFLFLQSMTWTTETSNLGAEIKSYNLEKKKFHPVEEAKAHHTTVDYLRPFKLSNGRNYMAAVLGPRQVPQTYHETLTFTTEEVAPEVEVPSWEFDVAGNDVDHPSQYYQQIYIILADGEHSRFSKSIILDSWGGGQNCFAFGNNEDEIVYTGFKDGTIRAYDANEKDWKLLYGVTNTAVNTLLYYSKSKTLLAGLDNGKLLIKKDKEDWKTIETGWGGKHVLAKAFVSKDNKELAILALSDGAVFCFDLNKNNFLQLKDHLDNQYPTALSKVHSNNTNDNIVFCAREDGSILRFNFSYSGTASSNATMIRGAQPVMYLDEHRDYYNRDTKPTGFRLNAHYYANKLSLDKDGKKLYVSYPFVRAGYWETTIVGELARQVHYKLDGGGGISSCNINGSDWKDIAPRLELKSTQGHVIDPM